MSARIEAAAKAIDAVEYEPGDNAVSARMAADRVSLAGTEVGLMMQKRAGYFRNGYLIVPPVSREEYPLGGATRHRPALFDDFAKECEQAAAALAGLAGENARLKTALNDTAIALDYLRTTNDGRKMEYIATEHGSRLRIVGVIESARAALQEPPDA